MTIEYTARQNQTWRAEQPQKMIVAKVVIKSDKGNILLLKSNYKKTWQLPGGGVEDGESPLSAVIREVVEETGLTIRQENLVIKDTIYRQGEESLFILYESTTIVPEDSKIQIAEDESTAYQFINPANVLPLLSDYYFDFWKRHYL